MHREARGQNSEEVLMDMLKLHVQLEHKLMDLENRTRSISIYRVPEGKENERVTVAALMGHLLCEGLKL